MHRSIAALGVLLVLNFTGPMGIAAQDEASPAGVTKTDMRLILPYSADGINPELTVTATEDGVCGFESTAALGRPDAWDCIGASNQIYDPCFENPFVAPDEAGEVACFESPFATDVVLLTLTEPLVREKDASSDSGGSPAASGDTADATIEDWDLPWALELANGDQCTLLHGTLMVFAGQVAHYGCADGGVVLGETNRSRPVWTVSYLADGDFASSLVEVIAAWS